MVKHSACMQLLSDLVDDQTLTVSNLATNARMWSALRGQRPSFYGLNMGLCLPFAVGLSLAASVWITGAFHEDGWADTCDALGGHVSRERALEIMKDSRIGTYGAVGLVLMLGLKAAVLVSLVQPLVVELNDAQTSHVRQVLLEIGRAHV